MDTLREVLKEGIDSGQVSLGAAARKMAMSRRSLQRELKNQGTNFRDILDSTRFEVCADLLRRPRVNFVKVAVVLGFADLSSFYRAFKRWTGKTPREFLRQ